LHKASETIVFGIGVYTTSKLLQSISDHRANESFQEKSFNPNKVENNLILTRLDAITLVFGKNGKF